MKVIEVPVYNDDGSIKITQQVSPEEAQVLLQFAINFLAGVGLSASQTLGNTEEIEEDSDDDWPDIAPTSHYS